jgi:hypothetical protein
MPVHAGDKALTRETPVKRGRVNRYDRICQCFCSSTIRFVPCAFFINKQFCTCANTFPPPFHGSLPRKSLISRMDWVSCTGDINLPHDLPPTKKSSTIKSWPTFYDQYFWKFPIWNSCADEKCLTGYHLNIFTIRISRHFSSAQEFQMGNFQKYWS